MDHVLFIRLCGYFSRFIWFEKDIDMCIAQLSKPQGVQNNIFFMSKCMELAFWVLHGGFYLSLSVLAFNNQLYF